MSKVTGKRERHLTLVVNNTRPQAQAPAAPEVEIDSRVLLSLRALSKPGEKDYLNDLIDRFVKTTPELLAKLEHAIHEGNGNAAIALAQFLKGSAFNLGITDLAKLASRLEMLCAENNLKSALLLYPDVCAAFERAKEVLQSHWRHAG